MYHAVSGFDHRGRGYAFMLPAWRKNFALFPFAHMCFLVSVARWHLGSDSDATFNHTELPHPSSFAIFAGDDPP